MSLRGWSFHKDLLLATMLLSWMPLAGGFLRIGQACRGIHASTRLSSIREPVGEVENRAPLSPPKTISPSSIADYKTCPQLYRFRYIDKVPEPPKEALVRGSMIHEALELLYEQPPSNRTREVLHDLFRAVWRKDRDRYAADLFPTVAQQREFGLEGLKLLDNYFMLENPQQTEPKMREFRMRVKLDDGGPTVTGVVDRVDEVGEDLIVVDYKTGKAPELKYSTEVNERIVRDKFFQLKVYGLLLQRQIQRLPTKLTLMYFTGAKGPQAFTLTLRPGDMEGAEQELREVWGQILESVEKDHFPTKVGKLCDWCSCKSICPAWGSESWAALAPPPSVEQQLQDLPPPPPAAAGGRAELAPAGVEG